MAYRSDRMEQFRKIPRVELIKAVVVSTLNIAPSSVVVIRDQEWLMTKVDESAGGALIRVQGLSELIRNTMASFYEALESITVLDPADATVTPDSSSGYRTAKLRVEATLRKTPIPLISDDLVTSLSMLADAPPYQQAALRQAREPANLRPRILLADATERGSVGISRSMWRVIEASASTSRHDIWTRFALPLARLDSRGILRLHHKLSATRNLFTYYRQVIISIETSTSNKYVGVFGISAGTQSSSRGLATR